ncbi:hypothetical protein GDO78_006566 [Eleutherodactylus coqui]|uniref:Rho GTPase-activating protein 8 n=1 Tax=Eleutherodactylus coqui TaxID=57060 RepID=A0A8J6FNT0_ELECQ|nr:hypothetical protein GDO78_006566 [Eleutherodactylus coqui]
MTPQDILQELQKDEEEQAQLSGDPVDSPMREANDASISHPYYDIARHGIIHVAGEYLRHTLDQYVENDYTLVYFHYGLNSRNKPSLSWLQSAYKAFDRKYKKNLKALYVVHPTNFIKVLWKIFKPVISHKFGKKVLYMNHLSDLRDHLRFNRLIIPQDVLHLKNKNQGALIPPVMEQTISYLKANDVESILRVNSCKQIAQRLPDHNYAVLKYLMCFLNMVSMENISNKMTASNLACVFGVNLVWPQEGAPSINALVPVNLFTELMIEFYPKIFNSRTIPGETLP